MIDFLTFKTFIAPSVLLWVYAAGAVLMPVLSYYAVRGIVTRYLSRQQAWFFAHTTSVQRLLLLLMSLGCFFCMEIMWRIMFEFVVAYFDMHEALIHLDTHR